MSRTELELLFGKTASCPPVETLVAGEQTGMPDRHMRSHVNGCLFCKAELASWRAFEYSEPTFAEGEAVNEIAGELDWRVPSAIRRETQRPARTRTRFFRVLGEWFRSKQRSALSLVFVCSVLVVISLQIQFRHSSPLVSRLDTPQSWRGNTLSLVAPTGRLDHVPNSFKWESIPNAREYQVRVLAVDRAELWARTVTGTNFVVDQDLKNVLARHSAFFWRVTGLSSEGRALASSELERFEIKTLKME